VVCQAPALAEQCNLAYPTPWLQVLAEKRSVRLVSEVHQDWQPFHSRLKAISTQQEPYVVHAVACWAFAHANQTAWSSPMPTAEPYRKYAEARMLAFSIGNYRPACGAASAASAAAGQI
jgi:hypothetical protein